MHANIVSDRPPLTSLIRIFLLVVILGWVIIGQTIGILFGSLIYDGDFLSAMSDLASHPDLRDSLLLAQGIGSALGLIIVPWCYLNFSENRRLAVFFKRENQWPQVTLAVFVLVVAVALGISPVTEWNATLEFPDWMAAFGRFAKESEAAVEAMLKTIMSNLTPTTFFFSLIVAAVIPAVGEELVFRGLIQSELQRAVRNPHLAILITSVIFSAIHMQFMGFFPRMLIGAFLGYLYYWSGNLWVPMLAHFFNNALQVVGLYMNQQGVFSFDMESTESAPLPLVAAAVVIGTLLLLYLKGYFASRSAALRDPA